MGRSDNGPVIRSLLDTDFYKFTMGYVVYKYHRDVKVRYGFRCRTKGIKLSEQIREEDLRRELDQARALAVNNSELAYLRGVNEYKERMFPEEYLQFLKGVHLPEYDLEYRPDGSIRLEVEGPWSVAIYWETLILSVINELYYRKLMAGKPTAFGRDRVMTMGGQRLADKIDRLKASPWIVFTDFGTRRRFSREWQEYVVGALAEELSPLQFRGTSNVRLAMDLGLTPMGTSAHEMFMVAAGVAAKDGDEAVRVSHNLVLREWWETYGAGLSVALTDTFGSDFFFRDMTREQARDWKGLRQDSGDPVEFGKKAVAFYRKHEVDPLEKLIVFSDGLTLDTIDRLYWQFKGAINTTFGWGTNLTNDLGLEPLSLVVKPIRADGRPLVKLSDNLAKATGDAVEVARYKRIFGYTSEHDEECTY